MMYDLVRLPDRWLSVEDDTAMGKGALLEPPALQGTPIEHVGVYAFYHGDVPRLFPFEHPQRHASSDLPLLAEV